ncbi:putative Cathepsin B [Paratrimastix pyriformis]|uniref:Cathepsin B n=1 Tax=Paratrimastix pyriformis TaxID=342808 RepID=A0ABQ8UUI4_9EUKA|nr:putative Cathepsin B [Paratrimastix pyriformis]
MQLRCYQRAIAMIVTLAAVVDAHRLKNVNFEFLSEMIENSPNILWKPSKVLFNPPPLLQISTSHHSNQLSRNSPSTENQNPRVDTLPPSFDLRTRFPRCPLLNSLIDQGKCGSCWAISLAGILSDRACIANITDKPLSTQFLLACDRSCYQTPILGQSQCQQGCNGGHPEIAISFLTQRGLPPDSCVTYLAKDTECPAQCDNGNALDFVRAESAPRYLPDEATIMREIVSGPVSATFFVYADLLLYHSGVYHHIGGPLLGGHAIKLIGFGIDEETNAPYWLCQNSWGHWGEDDSGTFRILRGQNECGIEENCFAFDAALPTPPGQPAPAPPGSELCHWNGVNGTAISLRGSMPRCPQVNWTSCLLYDPIDHDELVGVQMAPLVPAASPACLRAANTFVCGMQFPLLLLGNNSDGHPDPRHALPPCRSVCEAYVRECGPTLTLCSGFPNHPGRDCFEPPNYLSVLLDDALLGAVCRGVQLGYNTTCGAHPETSRTFAQAFIARMLPYLESGDPACHQALRRYICASAFPRCSSLGTAEPLCQDTCYNVVARCPAVPLDHPFLHCEKLVGLWNQGQCTGYDPVPPVDHGALLLGLQWTVAVLTCGSVTLVCAILGFVLARSVGRCRRKEQAGLLASPSICDTRPLRVSVM